jgi:putative transposase
MEKIIYYPEFVTATILNWKSLLKPDKYKRLIQESLQFLVRDNRIILYAYVILHNHIHLIWQVKEGHKTENVKRDFLKYTSGKIKADLIKNHPKVLPFFESSQNDRKYHFWERNSLAIELRSEEVFRQKLNYIHLNPVKAGICNFEEEYKYSSAAFYLRNHDELKMVTHYYG